MDIRRETDDQTGLRWYTNGEVSFLSVTTVLSEYLDTDESGLEYWKRQRDGTNGAPFHQHLYWYSGYRGTICHYKALLHFEGVHDADQLWGPEEEEAMERLRNGPTEETVSTWNEEADFSHEVPGDTREILYSVLADRDTVAGDDPRGQFDAFFETTKLVDAAVADASWFADTFLDVCDDLHVDESSVEAVEQFLLDSEVGYGGQTDLVYEDQHGDTVVVDLKTSSGLRWKHRLQIVAYGRAIERDETMPDTVDRHEVWRFDPDDKEITVHADDVPDHAKSLPYYTDEYWYDDKWGEFSYDDTDEMFDEFVSLVEKARDDIQ